MKFKTLIVVACAALAAFSTAQAASKNKKIPKHHREFAQADADSNGQLTVFEFAKTQGPGTPLVQVRKLFLAIDQAGAFQVVIDPVTLEQTLGAAIGDGFVTLAEWEAYRAATVKPVITLSRFQLADFNGDGLLDPVEAAYLVSPKVKFANTLRKFEKLDADDDGFISPAEFELKSAAEA